MNRLRSRRLSLAVVFAAGIILLAGSVAIGSNMGFKLNKPIVLAGAGQIGNNWTSIPYHNPYGNYGTFCTQTGLPSAGGNTAVLERLDGVTPAFLTQTCADAIAAGGGLLLASGDGVRIRVPNVAGNPTSIIIVGSHNPTLSIVVPASGAGQKGNKWFAVPYHTTAVTFNDICVQAGMTAGVAEGLNAATGVFVTKSCPSDDAKTANLVLGEFVRLRQPPAGVSFIPAHF